MTIEPISKALIAAGAKELVGESKSLLRNFATSTYDNLAVKFESCFQGHVQATFDKCSKIKNILYKDDAVDFKSRYVRGNFEQNSTVLSDSELLSRGMNSNNIVVTGTAGTGKTMFMRWAALALIEGMKRHGRVPLYLELRYSTNSAANEKFENYLYESTSSINDKASFGQFLLGLRSGQFIILLDAVDEINPSIRADVIERIIKFSADYPLCSLFISSRPDDYLTTVQSLSVFKTVPMNLEQIKEVISKLQWDIETKRKLLSRLDAGIYKGIAEFLSNPLLATILLITYDDAAEIPQKLTSFYQQAFEVLYQRHDATKGAYKRKLYAGLSLGDFQRVFSVFCFQTYLDYKVEFSDSELWEAFRDAIDYEGISVDPDNLVKDSMESACLIQKEGLDNSFVHRSFQEFFCACFIEKYKEDDVFDLIDEIFVKEEQSNTLRMLYELSPETFEYNWLLPTFNELLDIIDDLDFYGVPGLSKMLDIFSGGLFFGVDSGEVEYSTWGPLGNNTKSKVGRWMAAVDWIKQSRSMPDYIILNSIIWNDYHSYSASLEEGLCGTEHEIEDRIEVSPFSEDEEDGILAVRIEGKDAHWLLDSGLPKLFEEFRNSTRQQRDAIVAKRDEKRSKIKIRMNGKRNPPVRY